MKLISKIMSASRCFISVSVSSCALLLVLASQSFAQTVVFTEGFSSSDFKDTSNTSLLWAESNTNGEVLLPSQTAIQSDFFALTTRFSNVKDSQKVIVTDINNDQWPDLLFLDNQSRITLHINNSGNFPPTPEFEKVIVNSTEPIYDFVVLDQDNDGDQDIVIVTSISAYSYINQFSDSTNSSNPCSEGCFVQSEDSLPIDVRGRARVMNKGDWDNDGDDDIAIAYDNVGLALLVNIQGILQDERLFDTTKVSRFSLHTQDLNLDGIDDLVSGNFNADNVIYFGNRRNPLNGNKKIIGSFDTRALATGDMNNDSTLDIWDAAYGASQVFAGLNSGATNYQAVSTDRDGVSNDTPINANSEQVLIWDRDQDGDLDSVELQNGSQPITLWETVNSANSSLRFLVADELTVSSVNDIAHADINRDGYDDLILARNGQNEIRINSANELTATSTAFTGIAQSTNINTTAMDIDSITLKVSQAPAVFADVDYAISIDGGETFLAIQPKAPLVFSPTVTAPDIRWKVSVNAKSNQARNMLTQLSLTLQNSDGEQPPIITSKAGALPWFSVLSILGLLILRSLRWVKRSANSKAMVLLSLLALLPTAQADDLSQIVSSNLVDDGLMLSSPLLAGDAFFVQAMAKGDFDGDGDNDIVVGNVSNGMQIFTNLGAANQAIGYAQYTTLPYSDITAIDTADINGDGRDDIVFTTSTQVLLLVSNALSADIVFDAQGVSNQGLSPTDVKFSDIDEDGDTDILVANSNLALAFYVNTGASNNTFILQNFVDTVYASQAMAIADINNDGAPDIALANQNEPPVILYQDNLSQEHTKPLTFIEREFTVSPIVANDILIDDVNEDGLPDLIIATDELTLILEQQQNLVEFSIVLGASVSALPAKEIALASLGSIDQDCQRHIVSANNGGINKVQQFNATTAQNSATNPTIVLDSVVDLDTNSAISNAVVIDNPDNDDDDDIIIAGPGVLMFYHNRLSELALGLCQTDTATTLSPLARANNIKLTLQKENGEQTCNSQCLAKANDTLTITFDIATIQATTQTTTKTVIVYNKISPDVSIENETTNAATASYTFVNGDEEGSVPIAINLGRFGLFDFPEETVIFDNTAPQTPSVNVFEFNDNTLTLTAQTNEAGSAQFAIIHPETTQPKASALDLNFSAFGVFDISDLEQFPLGQSITVSVIAIDRAGNQSAMRTITVTKSQPQQAPIITSKAGAWQIHQLLLLLLLLFIIAYPRKGAVGWNGFTVLMLKVFKEYKS